MRYAKALAAGVLSAVAAVALYPRVRAGSLLVKTFRNQVGASRQQSSQSRYLTTQIRHQCGKIRRQLA
jgi:hypothetical protein